MIQRLRKRQGGFTLIELLIVVAIIGIIAALLIPNFLDALQKAKQKRTVADVRNLGTAQMSWLTDQIAAGAAGSTQFNPASYPDTPTAAEWATLLVDQYIQSVPEKDGWKTNYLHKSNTPEYGSPNLFMTQSYGADATAQITGSVVAEAFDPTDYNQDIIWADGFFVRWPQKLSQ